jgi:hypothetical protein
MLIKKALLAAAAVVSLAVPAAAMAQDYSGYRNGYNDAPYGQTWRGDDRRGASQDYRAERARFEYRREQERRHAYWRAHHRQDWQANAYGGSYDSRGYDHGGYGRGDYRGD